MLPGAADLIAATGSTSTEPTTAEGLRLHDALPTALPNEPFDAELRASTIRASLAHGRAEAFERMDGSGQPRMQMHADGGLGQKPLDRATGKPRL